MQGSKQCRSGQSVVEIVLAAALFVIVAIPLSGVLLQSMQTGALSGDENTATQYASEGLEAARDIRNQSFSLLTTSTGEGVAVANGTWGVSGARSTFGKFARVISVSSVQRDGSGNIVASGGTLDPKTMKVVSTVSWGGFHSVALSTYLTNWRANFAASPTLTSISPTSTSAGSATTTLTLIGTNFISSSTVFWNASPLATTYISPTQVTSTIPAIDLVSAGTSSITVANPGAGGGTSTAQTFTIR